MIIDYIIKRNLKKIKQSKNIQKKIITATTFELNSYTLLFYK